MKRKQQIGIYLESEFYDAFMQLAEKQGVSASKLGRRVLVKHLMDSGVMPDDYVLEHVL